MLRSKPVVLVADREGDDVRAMVAFLRAHEFEAIAAHDDDAAHNVIAARSVDALVAGLRAPRIDGLGLLRRALERRPELCAVLITDAAGAEMAVDAMRQGAADFQVRPVNLDKLLVVLRRGLAQQTLVARAAELEGQLDERLALDRLTGRSRAIQRAMEQVRILASTRATILIEGEAGTGKGLLAQAIHRHSPRRDRRFVAVSCGALAPDVIEHELFGHEHGTPQAGGQGAFEAAEGGTLFLDDVGELPPTAQVKLLRVIQERAFERGGGGETLKVDVRLLAATQRDLAAATGEFRADLLQRLGVARIRMPALRDRREDIPALVDSFVAEFNRAHRRRVTGVTRGALERLTGHDWPGNVRELKNVVERMVAAADGARALDVSDLPPGLREAAGAADAPQITVGMTVAAAERALISATLLHTGHDKRRAAAMLGIGLRTLYRKIKEYGLPGDE